MTAYIRDVRSFCIWGTILIPVKSDVRDAHVVHRLITTSWKFDYNLPTKVLGEQLSHLFGVYYNSPT